MSDTDSDSDPFDGMCETFGSIIMLVAEALVICRSSPPPSPPREAKRRKLNNEQRVEQEGHDSEFWFDDGNIILVAQQGVEFCVYKGLLIKHSPVFRDMFTLPQEPTGAKEGQLSELPVVHLPDHPHGVRCLLRSVFFGNDLQYVTS